MQKKIEDLEKLKSLANWLDSKFKIPGIPITFGVDSLLGLIPGIGDTLTFTTTAYFLSKAHDHGLPIHLKLKILWNGFIDWIIGFIPFFGDLFDVAWKSNLKNVTIITEHLEKEIKTAQDADVIEHEPNETL